LPAGELLGLAAGLFNINRGRHNGKAIFRRAADSGVFQHNRREADTADRDSRQNVGEFRSFESAPFKPVSQMSASLDRSR
jgi:hypothetical protein